MFSLPGVEVDDTDRWADWVEFCAMFSDAGFMSRGDLEDVVLDSSLVGYEEEGESTDPYADGTSLAVQESASRLSVDTWQELRRRSRSLGSAYPFSVRRDELTRLARDWRDAPGSSSMLLADITRDYELAQLDDNAPFRRLFETIVQVSLERILRGPSVRFGVPVSPDWPTGVTSISDRIDELGNRLGLSTLNLTDVKPTDGDLGLDVVGRFSFGDDKPGSYDLLTQCATGVRWETEKAGEPSLELWKDLLAWDAIRAKAVAVPYRLSVEKDIRRIFRKFEAVVLDRLRIQSGRPDECLPEWCVEGLVTWAEEHLQKIPVSD